MTRRKFCQRLAAVVSAGVVGIWLRLRNSAPRVFIRAGRSAGYPGPLKSLGSNYGKAEWSG